MRRGEVASGRSAIVSRLGAPPDAGPLNAAILACVVLLAMGMLEGGVFRSGVFVAGFPITLGALSSS